MTIVEGDAGGAAGRIDMMANMVDHNEEVRETCSPANVGSTRRFDHGQLIRTDLPEVQKRIQATSQEILLGTDILLSH
ncbi:hypothetical protein [Bradyrhizobium erythrophlei]|uniref:Uncharacterized protein n=1 Tax=Bradyrhizobium erythrophlei TaxID=1437360 RepID=A0A1H4Q3X3_9BRAD|nr:hypothetical protein [Bradyrhizobium erythrophlei]SEC14142.1 hypothetical protein SAMN05444164_1128 [Bradyrhizobium erythrophlei]